jgi:branched-chain amino acid transport system permease protein
MWAAGALAVLVAISFVLSEFQQIILSDMLIIGLFAMSLNLILGYGGMVSFGHAAYYGIGAYTFAILTSRYAADPWIAMLMAPFVAGFFGLQRPELIADTHSFLIFTIIVFAISFALIWVLVRSPFILTLRAVRENSERAQFIGVNVRRQQLIVFVIGTFFAGLAGALIAMEKNAASVELMFWTTSAEPILASLLGGMYSLVGPAIGGGLLVFLNQVISRITPFWPLVLGVLTVAIVLAAPTGIVGLVRRIAGLEETSE